MSREQVVNELHKSSRKNFPRRRVVLKGIDDLWQADLVDMNSFAKFNHDNKYILTIIDGFSKYAWGVPLKNKSSLSIIQSFESVFKNYKRAPRNLHTDFGTEFYNKHFEKLMKKFNINHYSTYSHLKASIVERFNRTLKSKMWKMFSYRGSYKWIDKIDYLLEEYNNTKHRTIKLAPVDVNSKKIEKKLLNTVFKITHKLVKNRYKVGDYVRVSKYKGVFEKGYTPNWSPEIFKIMGVCNKFPVTYKLEDYQHKPIAGRFYETELQKTKNHTAFLIEKVLKKKNNRLYVKWYGFDNSHNSWINKTEIL